LCHVVKDPAQVRLSPIVKGQVFDKIVGRFSRLVFTLEARGVEKDSDPLRVEVSWNGQWSDDRDTMMRNFVVRTI